MINQEPIYVAGWGNIREQGKSPNHLRELVVPVIHVQICNRPHYYNNRVVDKSMFCAGYHEGGKDSCQGDSGGPAVLNRKGSVDHIYKLVIMYKRIVLLVVYR